MEKLQVVSLLVATRNESKYIKNCIDSILNQAYPHEYLEVIILDGQSTDDTRAIVENLIDGQNNCQWVDNPKITQSAAWNLGLDICHGDVISIVSGHVVLAPDYVSKAVDTLIRSGADMVGGTVRSISSGKVGEAITYAISHPFGVGGARFRYTNVEEETDSVFMGFCHRSVYENVGKYDEELVRNQDDEFSYRLRKAGGYIICNPEIVSYYNTRSTLKSLWKQYFQYGFWKVRVLQKHSKQMSPRQFIPPTFVFTLILGFLISLTFTRGWIFLTALAGIYLLANLAASTLIAIRKGWKLFGLLPIVFATIHFSYGLGFIAGLFKFWNRWGDKSSKFKVNPLR